MAKTDWKAEAKALKKKVKKLKSSITAAAGPVAGAVSGAVSGAVTDVLAAARKALKPVSPLAPAAFPPLPVIAGAEFAAIGAGVKYENRTRRDAGAACPRHRHRRSLHPLFHPVRLRAGLPGQAGSQGAGGYRRGDHRELRQFQRLHRQGRRYRSGRRDRRHGKGAGPAGGTRVLVLDRRHRRTPAA